MGIVPLGLVVHLSAYGCTTKMGVMPLCWVLYLQAECCTFKLGVAPSSWLLYYQAECCTLSFVIYQMGIPSTHNVLLINFVQIIFTIKHELVETHLSLLSLMTI